MEKETDFREVVRFFVEGKPVAKQSYKRMTGVTKTGREYKVNYQPDRVTNWADTVGWKAKELIKTPILGHVAVRIVFYMKTKGRVDLDNLSKNILDGLKEIAFGDDSEVVELHLKKVIDKKRPGAWIIISEEL